jgi:HSP20 family protein
MKDKEIKGQQKNEADTPAKPEVTREGVYFRPKVDIYETEKELTLVADLPGVKSEDLDIDLREDTLTILGKVKPDEVSRYLIKEYSIGNFHRQFAMSEVIDQEKIAANMKDGVLTLKLPKVDKAQPRKIAIK